MSWLLTTSGSGCPGPRSWSPSALLGTGCDLEAVADPDDEAVAVAVTVDDIVAGAGAVAVAGAGAEDGAIAGSMAVAEEKDLGQERHISKS